MEQRKFHFLDNAFKIDSDIPNFWIRSSYYQQSIQTPFSEKKLQKMQKKTRIIYEIRELLRVIYHTKPNLTMIHERETKHQRRFSCVIKDRFESLLFLRCSKYS